MHVLSSSSSIAGRPQHMGCYFGQRQPLVRLDGYRCALCLSLPHDPSPTPCRRGVGWLVASCEQPPLVLPFVHSGMEKVIPKGAALPQLGQEVRVLVGEPVAVDDLLTEAREKDWPEQQLQAAIMRRVGLVSS